jgi:uncharacterized membrane protein
MLYLVLKIVHLLAVVLFLGNIITGLFWKYHGDQSRDPRVMAHTMDGIIRADRWFTLPGVLLIIITGVSAAIHAGLPLLRTPWIGQSLILFALSGLMFGFKVAPLQKRIHTLALEAVRTGQFDLSAYRRLSLQWELWGAGALLTPLGALVLMVLKRSG